MARFIRNMNVNIPSGGGAGGRGLLALFGLGGVVYAVNASLYNGASSVAARRRSAPRHRFGRAGMRPGRLGKR
jgi:hypothetical protein